MTLISSQQVISNKRHKIMTKMQLKTAFLSWTLLILVTLISETLGCGSRSDSKTSESRTEHQKPKHQYRYHFNDPRYLEYTPTNRKHLTIAPVDKLLVPEYDLKIPATSCGKTLCADIPGYPLDEINRAIDRARNILRLGGTIIAFQRKGLNYSNFVSKYDSFWYGERAPDHEFVEESSECKEHVNTIYPQEGYSTEDKTTYYIVNVPTAYRGLTQMTCESDNQMCIRGNDVSDANKYCRQMYREEQLLALPIGKSYIDVEDFELKTFYVPTGCACIASS